MNLVSSKKMLLDAQKKKYAIGAFNVENVEMIKAVLTTAHKYQSPLILQTTPSTLKYLKPLAFKNMAEAILFDLSVPVALHLDHGDSYALVLEALKAGYTSIMIDGSKLPYIENVRLTEKVHQICSAFDIPVEGELGAIGGKEDSLNSKLIYTNPSTAADFSEKSGVDSLAVAIGTAHGIYKSTPKLDYDRLSQIREKVDVPLVLHGASGLTEEQIQECIVRGICKVNFATELRIVYSDAVRAYLAENSKEFDPKKYGTKAMQAVQEKVLEKLKIVNSIGRACEYDPKLVIFDFDGTIVDSEKIYVKFWIEAAKQLGYDLSYENALKLRSLDSQDAEELLQDTLGRTAEYQAIRNKRKELMTPYLSEHPLELKKGILEALEFLSARGYKTIIASASDKETVLKKLNDLNLTHYFSEIVSVKDVSRGKPHPDIYYKLQDVLHIPTEDMLVIEDSPNGVIASKTAGCKTVMIPDLSEPDTVLENYIDVVLPDASYLKNIFK